MAKRKESKEEKEFKTRIDWEDVDDDEEDDDFVSFGADDVRDDARINRDHKRRMKVYKETGEYPEGDFDD